MHLDMFNKYTYFTIYFKTQYSLRGAFLKLSSQNVNNNVTHFDPCDPKSEAWDLDYTICSCSTQLSTISSCLPPLVVIFTLNSKINTISESFKREKNIHFQRLSIYEQLKSSS